MPRDKDRNNRRPPGRRGPPSRGEAGERRGGFRKGGGESKGHAGRAAGSFRKDRDGAPRGDGSSGRGAGKRFGDRPRDGKKFGARRSFDKGEGEPRKDRDHGPRREFSREDRPKRAYRPREDRGERRDARSPPSDAPRSPSGKDGERPQRRNFKRDGDRPARREFDREDRPKRAYRPREDRGGERRDARPPRRDAPRGPRKDGERPQRRDFKRDGDRPERRDSYRNDRPRGDRPFRGKPRDERRDARPAGDRPRFSRDRNERDGERPRPKGPRNDRAPRTSHAWRERPPGDGRDERSERTYEHRPFGGRGEYRERKPDRDSRKREAETAPAKAKKAGDRIAKLMARAGLCSRREAEEWVRQGRVSVNGRVITSPALDVTSQDKVLVDGAPLPEREHTRLFLFHKPKGLVTTHADPEGRPTVFDSLPEGLPRLISIGRLDFNTEGLLLLTNDGGLARVLELPDTGWLRRYRVRAHGDITQDRLDELRKGVEVDGVKYGPIEATLERDQGSNVWLVFAIREGKNREVRNVMSHLGLEVNRLIRISYGPFQLSDLPEGEVQEVKSRTLRDQLGERIATQAGAEFGVPAGEADTDEQPRRRTGLIADRKGRRVLVERSGRDGEDGDDRPRTTFGGYKGKRGRAPRDA